MNKQTLKAVVFAGLFAIPFIPFLVWSSFFFPFITTKVFAWRIIVEVVFAAWLLLAFIAPEYRPRKSPVLYAVGAFLLVIGLANLFGVAPVKSFWSNFERMEGFVSLLHLGAFFLVIGSVFKAEEWRKWWGTSLVASFLMVLYCSFQLAGTLAINQGGARVDGTFGNASYLAVYMLFHIFIALIFLWRNKGDATLRWMYGFLILAQTWVLYHTATRGAILGLIGGLLILALLNVRNKEDKWLRKSSIALIVGLVIVVGGVFFARNSSFVKESVVLARFTTISAGELKSGGRAFVWPMALEGIKERPLLGWGQDNFNYVFNENYDPKMYNLEPWFDRAHNIFLDWGVAGGLLGLLSYLSLYAALFYVLWSRKTEMLYQERTILTALLAAYFFHNFFVFDHLVSYILFFSLLAYLHERYEGATLVERIFTAGAINKVVLPLVSLALLSSLYFVNWKPMAGNYHLILALKYLQTSEMARATTAFKKSYESARLGRSEAVEQIATHSANIFGSPLPNEEKNAFYSFATDAVVRQAEESRTDARYQIVAGVFFTQEVSTIDRGIEYLKRAQALMPGKQLVYFELGSALINKGDREGALLVFKQALDLAPEYEEAKLLYLLAAIYGNDRSLERELLAELREKAVVFDERIISAYYISKRIPEVIRLLERRVILDPGNAATYADYIRQVQVQ